MTKLHLKRTPAEEQERAQRKAYRAAKRAAKRKRADSDDPEPGSSSRNRKYSNSDDHLSSHNDTVRAELEEMRFREKLWEALGEDERLDGVNARSNDYTHIPDRWARDEHDMANPQYMDDDEYAEWVREGMWKKKHAREYEEQAKRDAERAARRAREKEIKAETARFEKIAREQEERRRKQRQTQREEEYRQRYEQQWKALLGPRTQDHGPLKFQDIPWPLFSEQFVKLNVSDSGPLQVEDITPEAIASFLLPDVGDMVIPTRNDAISRRNRDKLKETLLRFHPDKFEGRFMHRVLASDAESVREAVGQVVRALNLLMSEKS